MKIQVQPGIMGKCYIICLFLWSFLFTLTRQTTLDGSLLSISAILFTVVWALIRIFIIVKIVTDEIDAKTFLKILFLIVISLVTYLHNDSNFLTAFVWFILGAKGINHRFSVRAIFFSQLLAVIILFSLSNFGFIENFVTFRKDIGNNLIRYSYGFDNPNTFAARIFQIFTTWIFLKKDQLSIREPFLGVILAYISFRYSNSRTVYYLLLLLSILILIHLFYIKFDIKIGFLLNNLYRIIYLIPLFAIYIIYNFNSMFYFISSIATGTILSRIQLIKSYVDFYGLSMFGKPILSTYRDSVIDYNLYSLDNAYVYLLIGFGIIPATILLLMYLVKVKQFWKNGDYVITIIMVTYLLYGLFETTLIRFTFNFTLIFLSDFLWNSSIQKIGSTELNKILRKS